MKRKNTKRTLQLQKYRSRLNPADVFYAYVGQPPHFIDGVEFLQVFRSPMLTRAHHYVKRDSLEKVKD